MRDSAKSSDELQPKPGRARRVARSIGDVVGGVTTKLGINEDEVYIPVVSRDKKPFESLDAYYARVEREEKDRNIALQKRAKVRRRKHMVYGAGAVAGLTAIASLAVPAAKSMIDGAQSESGSDPTDQPDKPSTTHESETSVGSLEQNLQNTQPSEVILTEQTAVMPNQIDSAAKLDGSFDPGRCDSIDVDMPFAATVEGAMRGAKTEFALDTNSYKVVAKMLEDASSKAEAESIVRDIFRPLHVNVIFEDPELKYDDLGENDTMYQPSDLRTYSDALARAVSTLSFMPKAMFMLPGVHQLLITPNNIKSSIHDPAGVYEESNHMVRIEVDQLNRIVLAHEWGHALQGVVCGNYGDSELTDVLVEARSMIDTDARYRDLNNRYQNYIENGGEALSQDEYDELQLMLDTVGLPSAYGTRNEMELFAEIFEYLTIHGYEPIDPKSQDYSPIKAKLLEAVIERIQAAMPDLDVSSWLQYASYYYPLGLTPDKVDPKEVLKLHMSSLDVTIRQDPRIFDDQLMETLPFTSGRGAAGRVMGPKESYPAIAITKSGVHEYIYAVHDVNSGNVYLYIRSTGDMKADDALTNAGRDYLYAVNPKGTVVVAKPGDVYASDKDMNDVMLVLHSD